MLDTESTHTAEKRQQKDFVTAAVVAAQLITVLHISQEISLSAKNANSIAARAGEIARGFRPIANFMSETAGNIINVVKRINEESLALSRNSVRLLRTERTVSALRNAMTKCVDSSTAKKIEDVSVANQAISDNTRLRLKDHLLNLLGLLDDINRYLQAATVVTVSARVEASQVAEFSKSLGVVADRFEMATERIVEEIDKSRTSLLEAFILEK